LGCTWASSIRQTQANKLSTLTDFWGVVNALCAKAHGWCIPWLVKQAGGMYSYYSASAIDAIGVWNSCRAGSFMRFRVARR